MAAVSALAGGASGFADSRLCPVLAETDRELAAATRHPGCYQGASKTIHGDVRGPATCPDGTPVIASGPRRRSVPGS